MKLNTCDLNGLSSSFHTPQLTLRHVLYVNSLYTSVSVLRSVDKHPIQTCGSAMNISSFKGHFVQTDCLVCFLVVFPFILKLARYHLNLAYLYGFQIPCQVLGLNTNCSAIKYIPRASMIYTTWEYLYLEFSTVPIGTRPNSNTIRPCRPIYHSKVIDFSCPSKPNPP